MPSELRKKTDEERKRLSREALLEAARKVFADKGFHSTLISDIVAEAKVGQGTFYRNFSSKRDVFEALMDRFIATLLGEFSDMSAHPPRNVEEYKAASIVAIGRVAAIIDQNRELARLFLREAPAIDRDFEERISSFCQQFALLAGFYLDYAISQGFARPCRSDIVAQSIVGIGLHLIDLWWKDGFPSLSREALIEEVVTFAFKGFGLFPEQMMGGHE